MSVLRNVLVNCMSKQCTLDNRQTVVGFSRTVTENSVWIWETPPGRTCTKTPKLPTKRSNAFSSVKPGTGFSLNRCVGCVLELLLELTRVFSFPTTSSSSPTPKSNAAPRRNASSSYTTSGSSISKTFTNALPVAGCPGART
jgi:hypothetical protein